MDWIYSEAGGLIFPNKQTVREIPKLKESDIFKKKCSICNISTPQYISYKRVSFGRRHRLEYTCLICRQVVNISKYP